jgi:hypothetical protein
MNNAFFDSKTMQLLAISMAAIIMLVLIGVAVKVLFGSDVFEMISAGILGITGQSAQGTYRNVRVDAPIRQAYNDAVISGEIGGSPPPIGEK